MAELCSIDCIEVADLTTGYVDGDGVFDIMMEAVNSHLKLQYEEGRITGSDYAKLYLGGLQTTLQQAITFLLTKDKAEKEAELARQQIAESEARVIREDALAAAKIAVDEASVEKINAEICLLNAKCKTEKAQIADTIDGITVAGLVGKQKNLYQKQADGFDRDAEQKALKLIVDLYSVNKSADPDAVVDMHWFTTGSSTYDDLHEAINNAVVNAGLSQIYPSK